MCYLVVGVVVVGVVVVVVVVQSSRMQRIDVTDTCELWNLFRRSEALRESSVFREMG